MKMHTGDLVLILLLETCQILTRSHFPFFNLDRKEHQNPPALHAKAVRAEDRRGMLALSWDSHKSDLLIRL